MKERLTLFIWFAGTSTMSSHHMTYLGLHHIRLILQTIIALQACPKRREMKQYYVFDKVVTDVKLLK